MNTFIKTALIMIAAAGIAGITGCAGNDGESYADRDRREVSEALAEMEVTLGDEVNQLMNFQLQNFSAINDRNLIVSASGHDHYLVRLIAPCQNLRFAFEIRFDTNRRSSITRMDNLLVNGLHNRQERCPIDSIFRLDDNEVTE